MGRKAINWNTPEDSYSNMFFKQNKMQFWDDEVIPVFKDLKVWKSLSEEEKDVYKKVLGGLTLLDTDQGLEGMPSISKYVDGQQKRTVLQFMGMMEGIHARSYSTIFLTLLEGQEIDGVFEWVEENKYLQKKAEIINEYYDSIEDDYTLYLAMVASVFLESFLFYSGFFYPLFLSGQGKMVNSGEIINLIIRDESIHGVFVGLLAQEQYAKLSDKEKELADAVVVELLNTLMENEINYTKELYGQIDLHHDVIEFLKYNANKAMMNLGLEAPFEHEDVNPIVLNGLSTDTKTHDFFSTKGTYVIGKGVPLTDDDFEFVNDLVEERVF